MFLSAAKLLSPFILFSLAFILPVAVGAWILWPLDYAARRRRGRTQFTVIDFLGLVFLLQLAMALIKVGMDAVPSEDGRHVAEVMLYFLAWIPIGLIWARSIVVFSRAGVTTARDRGLTVFLVLPMAYFGTFSVPVLLYVAVMGDLTGPMRVLTVVLAVVLANGVLLAGVLSRRICRDAGY